MGSSRGTGNKPKRVVFDLRLVLARQRQGANAMNGIIYLIGLVVVIMFILSILGLR